jgi:hypothetical protein
VRVGRIAVPSPVSMPHLVRLRWAVRNAAVIAYWRCWHVYAICRGTLRGVVRRLRRLAGFAPSPEA